MTDKELIESSYKYISDRVATFIYPHISCGQCLIDIKFLFKMIRDISEGSSYENFVSGVTTFINNENVKLENDDDGLLLTNIRRYCEEAFKQK